MSFWKKSTPTDWLAEISFFRAFDKEELRNVAELGVEVELERDSEMLIDKKPRSATVIADATLKLLSFDIAAFEALLDSSPTARANVTKTLAGRVRANNFL